MPIVRKGVDQANSDCVDTLLFEFSDALTKRLGLERVEFGTI